MVNVRIELLPKDMALSWMDNNLGMLFEFEKRSRDNPDFFKMAEWIENRDALLGLLVSNKTQETVGFIVVCEQMEGDQKELFIWALYSEVPLSKEDYEHNFKRLSTVAKQIKASTIRFKTTRQAAWGRRLKTIRFEAESENSYVENVH